MKQIVYFLLSITAYSFWSCNSDYSVRGNGNVTEETIAMASFNKIRAGNNFEVVLIPADTEKVILTMDENLFDYTEVGVKRGELIIKATKNIQWAKSKIIRVYYKNIEKLNVSSAVDVKSTEPLKSNSLNLEVSSAGECDLILYCDELELSVNSAATARLRGEVTTMKADISSAATLKAYELKIKNAEINASSAAHADVYVTGEASLEASSAAKIKYRGNPEIKKHIESSAGKIKNAD